MSDETKFRLTPKGQLIAAIMSVFPDIMPHEAGVVWAKFTDLVYDHAAMSSDPEINSADYLAIVLDDAGGSLVPVEKAGECSC